MNIEPNIVSRRFLISELVLITLAILTTILPLIMSYQIMEYSEIRIFTVSQYMNWWILFTFMAAILALLEIVFLIFLFGYIKIKYELSLLQIIMTAVVGHIIFTAISYLVIWLSVLTKIENAFFGYLIIFIIEITLLLYCSFTFYKNKNIYKLN